MQNNYLYDRSPIEEFIQTLQLFINGDITIEIDETKVVQDALKEARKTEFMATKNLKVY